jgi:linoleoyl-CoA desaturase
MLHKQAAQTLPFQGDDQFLTAVRARVAATLDGRPPQGDPRLHRKGFVIGAWFAVSYGLLLTTQESRACQLILCISYGLAACALAFNVFHDANHGAWSAKNGINVAVSRLISIVLGPGRFFWRYKHHVRHHHAPNVFTWDDDVESRGFLRLSPEQPWRPWHRHQHWFFGPLYACNTVEWVFFKDFVQYFTGRINSHATIPRMTKSDHVEFWLSKAAHFAAFVLLPLMLYPAEDVLIGLAVIHFVMSLTLTIVFQLAHLNDRVDFPQPNGQPRRMENRWAEHQLRTTMNFGNKNWLLNCFTGGLNFQIEHHLFPRISHTYYPEISGIVCRTAHEYGLPYNCSDTFFAAVVSHFRLVRRLASPPSPEWAKTAT